MLDVFVNKIRTLKEETNSFALPKEYLCINLNKCLYKETNILVREFRHKK